MAARGLSGKACSRRRGRGPDGPSGMVAADPRRTASEGAQAAGDGTGAALPGIGAQALGRCLITGYEKSGPLSPDLAMVQQSRRAPTSPHRRAVKIRAAELGGATAAAVEDRQLAAEALQHHLGAVLLLPLLVGPLARLQLALDIHLRALLQVMLGHPRQVLVEDHHRVPLGLLLALPRRLVLPRLRRGDPQVHHRLARVEPPHLRVPAQIAY